MAISIKECTRMHNMCTFHSAVGMLLSYQEPLLQDLSYTVQTQQLPDNIGFAYVVFVDLKPLGMIKAASNYEVFVHDPVLREAEAREKLNDMRKPLMDY